jgi:hypothetical protein
MLSDSENKDILRKLRQDRSRFLKNGPWYQPFSIKRFFSKKAPADHKPATRKTQTPKPSKRRQAITNALALSILSVIVFGGVTQLLRRRPPTYIPNAELNQRLDSLFTAFNSRDVFNTERIQSELTKMNSRTRIDDDSLAYLKSLSESAKHGEWSVAAQRLHEFIYQSIDE